MNEFAVGTLVGVVEATDKRGKIHWTLVRPGMQGVVISGASSNHPSSSTWSNTQDVLFGNVVHPIAIPLLREILPPPLESVEEEEDVAV